MKLLKWYKNWLEKRRSRQFAKNLKLISSPKTLRDERQLAIDYFSHHSDPDAAVQALLQRFEFTLEHGINDVREKEACMTAIVGYGQVAIPHIMKHLKSSLRIAWPIKVLSAISGKKDMASHLLSLIDFGDIAFDQAKVDKNYDILCHLMDEPPSEVDFSCLIPFLKDGNERVRLAAADVLIAQMKQIYVKDLAPLLTLEGDDNLRLKLRVAQAFVEQKWEVPPGLLSQGAFLEGFYLEGNMLKYGSNFSGQL